MPIAMAAPILFFPLLLLCLVPSLAAAAARVPAVIVFGDSTVDSGNNNQIDTVLRSDFRPYGRDLLGGRPTGRFCNGRLATDFISEALGLPPLVPAYLDPEYSIEDFAKGVCFASAGTGLDNATSDVLSVIPLWKEVEYFQEYKRRLRRYAGKAEARRIVAEAIYIVSIGTNDFLENYFLLVTGRFQQFTVDEFEDFLMDRAAEFLTAIYREGARKISFTGLGAIGCVPLERTTNALNGGGCMEEYNKVARDFNVKLQALIARLCATLPGLKLRYAAVYDGLLRIIADPSSEYVRSIPSIFNLSPSPIDELGPGIENVDAGCCATGRFEMGFLCDQWSPFTCEDADKYIFWDAFHPTEKINRLMAETTLRTSLAEFI